MDVAPLNVRLWTTRLIVLDIVLGTVASKRKQTLDLNWKRMNMMFFFLQMYKKETIHERKLNHDVPSG